jgi:hypothetical protein
MKSKISVILFLIATSFLHSQSDLKILSSDFKSITIEYTPIYSDTALVKYENSEYRKIGLYLGGIKNFNDWGFPLIVVRRINVGVPSEFGNTIEVLASSYKEISGSIVPVPKPVQDTLSVTYEYNKNTEYFSYKSDDELISFEDYGLVRGVGSQTISINPVKFDAAQNRIKLYSKIIFKINFSSNGILSNKPADDLIDGAIVNYDVAKYWNRDLENKKLNKVVIANSVLATGRWFRFEASEEGIYRINKSDLAAYGIDANTVDPRTIKIYNNGGKALPELNTAIRPVDLEENAIFIVGQEDGKFDEADYILFYGRGTNFWDYDSDGKTIKRFFHPYSTKNYYWITSGNSNGKRMLEKVGLNTTPTIVQTTSIAYASLEEDKINLGKTGRNFVGDNFSSSVTSRTYTNTLNGLVSASPINYSIGFVVGTPTSLTLRISENGNQILQRNLNGHDTDYKVGIYHSLTSVFNQTLTDNRSILNFSVTPSTISTTGYLDYFTIQYEKELKSFSDYLMFFSNPTGGIIEYNLINFSNSDIKVLDVTDNSDVKIVTNYTDLSGGECKFQVDEGTAQRSKYIAVGVSGFKIPTGITEISNSNIRGEEQGAKFIIVTHKNFKDAAYNLKTYRETQAPVTISTYVVDIEQVYNEFSGGVTDPTALRDYLKYAYDNWQIKPKYILFYGKGTYDYKNIEGYNDNFVPTWQSSESFALKYSYTTDDFFGRLSGTDAKIDIALGRITCSNPTDANSAVNKIIDYELNQNKGDWRNLITLIADDGVGKDAGYEGPMHTAPSEDLANLHMPKSFNFNKIYSAAYPDVITGQGRRKPPVNQAIIDAINKGTLFLNYFGHGSPELWAHEYIFEKSVALPQLHNDKYFFLGAATCDFGYFDIPNYQSAAEAITFLPNSGAIASFTASRLVFAGENERLMHDFADELFIRGRDTLNLGIPIGKAALESKTTSTNDQKYNILGDPTLRLLVPQYASSIDSINGQALITNVQIKALSKSRISGTILKPDNTIWNDFNGEGALTIYDSERDVRLSAINYDVKIPGGIIFNGRVSIVNGKFSEEFIVPKDISYENKNGKVVLYFSDNNVDGIGYTNKIIVGGTDSSLSNDGKGPDIEIYFDDIANLNGNLVNKDSKLIVALTDETGINTTGTGVGHKLEGILNQQLQNPIDFTNYYSGDLDAGGKSGKINYQFSTLESGDNHLQVKAWDVFNNFSEDEVYFSVVDGNSLEVRDVFNYPNPFTDRTQFTFQQNLSSPIDVKIKVYTIAGRLIKEIEKFNVIDRFVAIDWDGKDNDGDQIANGTYLYKLIVKSVDGEFNKSVLGKLAVIK